MTLVPFTPSSYDFRSSMRNIVQYKKSEKIPAPIPKHVSFQEPIENDCCLNQIAGHVSWIGCVESNDLD